MTTLQNNIEILNKKAISFGILSPTKNALDKSIIDAIYSLRIFFKEKKYHNYEDQKKGENNKSLKSCKILLENKIIDTKVSLYRPETKDGDPRIWIYKLKKFVSPNNNIFLIVREGNLFIFNSSKIDLKKVLNEQNNKNEIFLFFDNFKNESNIAVELKDKLKKISCLGFLESKKGDKEVGELLERQLGISANSSKNPDYKGIELKAKHNNKTRANLFAQVPNYTHSLSKIKKITEIADQFGYHQNGHMVLRNTIFATKSNSQGLKFNIDYKKEILFETSVNDKSLKDFAVWEFQTLINRLKKKHKETFWITAEKKEKNNKLYFKYKSVVHTANPNAHMLIDLISKDIVTMDHLISTKGENGKIKRIEKGPLFKIKPKDISLLIPTVDNFDLS